MASIKAHRAVPTLVPVQRIERKILELRGQKVMLSNDLADLYGVTAGHLNEAVKRNRERFPDDFMFQVTAAEAAILKSQFAISSWGGSRFRPYAFTEQGIAMLSAVLRSPTAVAVSIEIVRVFVRLRELLASHDSLRKKLEQLEAHLTDHDHKFAVVFDAIRQIMDAEQSRKRKPPIGYLTEARKRPGR